MLDEESQKHYEILRQLRFLRMTRFILMTVILRCALSVSNNSGQVFTAHAKNMHSAQENSFRFMKKNDCFSQ